MSDDLVQRAQWGDLSGQNWAGLVRLSFESGHEDDEQSTEDKTARRATFVPMTGRDIKGRDEQDKDNRRYVESRGGSYVYTYEEPDTSAWKRRRVRLRDGQVVYRVVRPVFEGALDDLKHGLTPDGKRLDGLIVYDIDRLTRDNRHLEDAIEVVENFRRPIIDITGTLDLLSDNGRAVARVVTAMSNKQSADTARRVKRKHVAMQSRGIPGGGRRPYGWQDDRRTLDPIEAEHVRQAAHRLIAGTPLSAVVASWNSDGLKTPSGIPWTSSAIKFVLRNPRICGYRGHGVADFNPETGTENHRMEIVFDDQGKPVIGQWEPILSVDEWQAVTDVIGSNRAASGANTRKYLLTGTLRCDKDDCGQLLRATKAPPSAGKPEGYFYYNCPAKSSGRGCGGVRIPGPETDKLVTMMVIAKYEEEAAAQRALNPPESWTGEEDLERVKEDIADLKAARKARQITAERYFSYLAENEAEERRLLADRNRWLRSKYAAQAVPVDLRKDWEGLLLAEQRAYIEDCLSAVLVKPAIGRGGPVRDRLAPLDRPRAIDGLISD
ncbi:site-specific DNA recombinase [Streptacidiphilus sp. MAP12-16]|uniref:recombinase family protein n=1 Tax=Streptacidiphilus sp. MAP12-16 TaxID=3156300 RepID=UPI003511C4ED